MLGSRSNPLQAKQSKYSHPSREENGLMNDSDLALAADRGDDMVTNGALPRRLALSAPVDSAGPNWL